MPTTGGNTAQRRFGVAPADRVNNHIDAAGNQVFELSGESLLIIAVLQMWVADESGTRTASQGEVELALRGGARDHVRAERFSDVDRCRTDTTGCAQHREGFARLSTTHVVERVVCRCVGEQERCRLSTR